MTTPTPAKPGFFSSAARKAHIGALLAILTAVVSYLVANEGNWTWEGTLVAVLSGVVAGLGVFQTTNAGTVYTGGTDAH